MSTEKKAVVVGGGMGGLFAARVLSEHFDEVLIVDRDKEPTLAEPRAMVPQGHHFHVLLPGGLDAMNGWFPGFTDDMVTAGSIKMRAGCDFVAYTNAGKSFSLQTYQPEPMDFGMNMYVQTRPALEQCVRNRVSALSNVHAQFQTIVEGPLFEDGRVAGVNVRGAEPISADLVVDASGRNSVSARWLNDLGFTPAPETYVNCDVHYSSVMVRPKDWDAFEGAVMFVMPSGAQEHGSRMGTAVKMPDGLWLVGLGARYGDPAPTDWEGFRAFGKTLSYSIWDEMVETAEPVGQIKSYHLPRAVRRHYEQLEQYPEGLLPIGDAVCFFNPTHGQGMSSAAGQCRGLEKILRARAQSGQNFEGLAKEFFPVASDWVRGPWIMAAIGDFENPMCTGDFPDADLPDLIRFGELAAAANTNPSLLPMIVGVSTLQVPLSAIHEFANV